MKKNSLASNLSKKKSSLVNGASDANDIADNESNSSKIIDGFEELGEK